MKSLFRNWNRLFLRTKRRDERSAWRSPLVRRRSGLSLEPLEQRQLLAVFAYSAATFPAITDYTFRLNGVNVEVVNTANTAQVLGMQSLASTTSVSITGQTGVNDTLRV